MKNKNNYDLRKIDYNIKTIYDGLKSIKHILQITYNDKIIIEKDMGHCYDNYEEEVVEQLLEWLESENENE